MATIARRKAMRRQGQKESNERLAGASSSGVVSQWGNSLGVRIPKGVARQLKLSAGEEVSIEVEKDAIRIRPTRRRRRKWSEAELLKGVTPEKVGGEIDWGGPVGREVG